MFTWDLCQPFLLFRCRLQLSSLGSWIFPVPEIQREVWLWKYQTESFCRSDITLILFFFLNMLVVLIFDIDHINSQFMVIVSNINKFSSTIFSCFCICVVAFRLVMASSNSRIRYSHQYEKKRNLTFYALCLTEVVNLGNTINYVLLFTSFL